MEFDKSIHDFDLFKSNVCHQVKHLGDEAFIKEIVQSNDIETLFHEKNYKESLYLVAMIDYLCRVNNFDLIPKYERLRTVKMKSIVYPVGVELMTLIQNDDTAKSACLDEAIPEFLAHNIVEAEIRNVF